MLQIPHAYLDAGSGSMLLQVLAGGFAALAVSAKLFWRQLLVFLRIRKPESTATGTESNGDRTAL